MTFNNTVNETVIVTGEGKLACSIAVCIAQANYPVTLYTKDKTFALENIFTHFRDLKQNGKNTPGEKLITIMTSLQKDTVCRLAVINTSEDIIIKQKAICELEKVLSPDSIIAINTESILLDELQAKTLVPERIIGLNWTEPAHTTFFLEIISNATCDSLLTSHLINTATTYWGKDPYHITSGFSIRARLMSAMSREAFYLVENGYASFEDIDRACRNDAGYYLPFAGNCRYMDLMGTYIYGVVMKDLNPGLAKTREVPQLINRLISEGSGGMQDRKGFYEYDDEMVQLWNEKFRMFSYLISELISNYPFMNNYENGCITQERNK